MMRRYLPYLRIVFSATCLIAAVLVIALWVRSCSTVDTVNVPLPSSWNVMFASIPGGCGLGIYHGNGGGWRWQAATLEAEREKIPESKDALFHGIWGRFAYVNVIGPGITVPDWFLIGMALALSAAPWLRWSCRFSIRTIAIVTALVAAVLGLAVYTAGK
jgi:hypothetical protein